MISQYQTDTNIWYCEYQTLVVQYQHLVLSVPVYGIVDTVTWYRVYHAMVSLLPVPFHHLIKKFSLLFVKKFV